MKTFKLTVTTSADLDETQFLQEVLKAETKANGTSLLRFHVKPINDEFKSVTDSLPQEDLEVIGYNKTWIDEGYNPKGTCACFISETGYWFIAKWDNKEGEYRQVVTKSSSDAPTHWTHKPKFN